MTSSFTVTTATSKIQLDDQQRGNIVFNVTNITANTVAGRADLASNNQNVRSWVKIQGESERDFAPNATEQYVVEIVAPLGAAIGTYSLSLNLVGVDDPDEDFTEGPSVAFEVSEPTVEPPKRKFNFSWWWIVVAVVAFLVLEAITYFSFQAAADNRNFPVFPKLLTLLVGAASTSLFFGSVVLLKDAIRVLVRGAAEPSSGRSGWIWLVAAGFGGLVIGVTTIGIFTGNGANSLSIAFEKLFAMLLTMALLLLILLVGVFAILILRYLQAARARLFDKVKWMWVALSGVGMVVLGGIAALIFSDAVADGQYLVFYAIEVLLLFIILIAEIVVYILLRRRLPLPKMAELSLIKVLTGEGIPD